MELFLKSLRMDIQLLLIKKINLGTRLNFITQKYVALVRILLGKEGSIELKNFSFAAQNLSDLGTLQSSIIDFYHDIVSPNIIKKSNPVILDVGANVGQFCSAAKLFYPKARIYCFEPDTNVYKRLEINTCKFKSVTLFNFGLGNKNEKKPFYIHDLSLMSSFTKYQDHEYDASNIMELELKMLDGLLDTKMKINILKVDVEGFELNTLQGALTTLEQVEYLLIELSLGRGSKDNINLELFTLINRVCTLARIVRFGRPLGTLASPICQDALIKLH